MLQYFAGSAQRQLLYTPRSCMIVPPMAAKMLVQKKRVVRVQYVSQDMRFGRQGLER